MASDPLVHNYEKILKNCTKTSAPVAPEPKLDVPLDPNKPAGPSKAAKIYKSKPFLVAVSVAVTLIILAVSKPPFVTSKDEETGKTKINWGFVVAISIGVSVAAFVGARFLSKKFGQKAVTPAIAP